MPNHYKKSWSLLDVCCIRRMQIRSFILFEVEILQICSFVIQRSIFYREPIRDDPALHASFVIVKHENLPMDIVAVDTCTGRRIYSFLSVGWALVADVDIESEKYRYMGGARFTVGVINRVISEYSIQGSNQIYIFLHSNSSSMDKQIWKNCDSIKAYV